MTTNCFDVVSLFDFKNAKRQRVERPHMSLCVGSSMCVGIRMCSWWKMLFCVCSLKGLKAVLQCQLGQRKYLGRKSFIQK